MTPGFSKPYRFREVGQFSLYRIFGSDLRLLPGDQGVIPLPDEYRTWRPSLHERVRQRGREIGARRWRGLVALIFETGNMSQPVDLECVYEVTDQCSFAKRYSPGTVFVTMQAIRPVAIGALSICKEVYSA